jgi:hypothetical protein
MHAPLAILTLFALLGQPAPAPAGRVLVLALPHALQAGETALLEVKVGILQRGAEIEIETTAGQPLGTISPFGIRSGQPAGAYTVPVPANAIANGHVSLRLLLDYGQARRAPTVKEVTRVRVKIMPAQ